MGKVISINISEKRGTIKNSVSTAKIVEGWGVEGDAHGGDWDRQISIFPVEALQKVPDHMKEEVERGGYTENVTISGISLEKFVVGTKLRIGDAEFQIFHIGKDKFKEHDRHYIISREGRFGKVLKSGTISVGDKVEII
ncbi:MOSC domain-containing protein [Clostridium sediminicola]|uniref:MOSC domain-containing protein n=1 Tax=Clostridium sediminicola TaxID=3114879 RepID=UPI0031F200CF